jgi:LacI family transcriptional regulator
MFASLEDYGARLGYRVEYYHFNNTSVCELSSLGRRWRARGIRGVLLGPFNNHYQSLSFEWDNLAWVSLGRAMEQPILHSVFTSCNQSGRCTYIALPLR